MLARKNHGSHAKERLIVTGYSREVNETATRVVGPEESPQISSLRATSGLVTGAAGSLFVNVVVRGGARLWATAAERALERFPFAEPRPFNALHVSRQGAFLGQQLLRPFACFCRLALQLQEIGIVKESLAGA